MDERPKDRRTLKTKKRLRDALAELLKEKELDKVTVQEISDRAEVNRVTFYNHYLDVYDLYDQTEEEVLVEIGLRVLKLDDQPSKECFSDIIDYIYENRPVFRLIFSNRSNDKIHEKLSKMLEGLLRKMQTEKQHSDMNDIKLAYQNCYRSIGCLAVIDRWVNRGFAESKETILDILTGLDSNTRNYMASK